MGNSNSVRVPRRFDRILLNWLISIRTSPGLDDVFCYRWTKKKKKMIHTSIRTKISFPMKKGTFFPNFCVVHRLLPPSSQSWRQHLTPSRASVVFWVVSYSTQTSGEKNCLFESIQFSHILYIKSFSEAVSHWWKKCILPKEKTWTPLHCPVEFLLDFQRLSEILQNFALAGPMPRTSQILVVPGDVLRNTVLRIVNLSWPSDKQRLSYLYVWNFLCLKLFCHWQESWIQTTDKKMFCYFSQIKRIQN